MRRRSKRNDTFAFYGGMAGAAIGLFVPSLRGNDETAAIMQIVWAIVGFLVGMAVGRGLAYLLKR